jgi:hypothetical protein
MLRRLAPLLRLVAATSLALLAIDIALFRSGLYARWTAPDSAAGSLVRATMAIDYSYQPGRRNVLVLGDSRIGEGLSTQLADAASERADLHFVNGSVPGTHPRVWNYLLRQIDPAADRFAAVALMVDYDSRYSRTDYVNSPLDISYTAPLLRIADSREFPRSFTAQDLRERALRAIWLPLQGLHDDARDFLAHPLERVHEIRSVRPKWIRFVGSYQGRGAVLPALEIDTRTGMPKDEAALPVEWREVLADYFVNLQKTASPQRAAANQAYQREWVGRIAARYRARGVPVIIFSMTRGPWQAELLPPMVLSPALSDLRDAGDVLALPADAFTELEKPEYFFDTLHLNSAGRERFSKLFAAQVAPLVR